MWQEIRKTLLLGWPIVLGNLTQMVLGIIDAAMVGAIHSSQLAAASLVNNIIGIPLIFGFGLTFALSPLVAAAQGSGDDDLPMRILYNGLWVVVAISTGMALALTLGIDIVYHMGQDRIVADLAQPYLRWMAWGMVPMVVFMAIKQFADGLGYTRLPMYISLASLPINVLFNYAFIFGQLGAPRLELEGAGIGTLLTRILIMLAVAVLVLRGKAFAPYRQRLADQLRLRRERLWEVVRLGIPSSMQYGMESAAFAISGIMAGWLGYQQQAAHQIAISLAALSFMVPLGISAAGSIRVGFAFGRRDWGQLRFIGQSTLFFGLLYGTTCAVLFILFRHQLPLFFNDEPIVLGFAANLLLIAAIFQLSDALQAIGVGLLRGMQDVRIPTLFILIAYWVIGLPSGYLFAFQLGWDIQGLWMGLGLGLSGSALLLSGRFLTITGKRLAGKLA